jgi:hypothetical protein
VGGAIFQGKELCALSLVESPCRAKIAKIGSDPNFPMENNGDVDDFWTCWDSFLIPTYGLTAHATELYRYNSI